MSQEKQARDERRPGPPAPRRTPELMGIIKHPQGQEPLQPHPVKLGSVASLVSTMLEAQAIARHPTSPLLFHMPLSPGPTHFPDVTTVGNVVATPLGPESIEITITPSRRDGPVISINAAGALVEGQGTQTVIIKPGQAFPLVETDRKEPPSYTVGQVIQFSDPPEPLAPPITGH